MVPDITVISTASPVNRWVEFQESVSYLPIKSPKSLTNKDLTAKSLFFKDLGKNTR